MFLYVVVKPYSINPAIGMAVASPPIPATPVTPAALAAPAADVIAVPVNKGKSLANASLAVSPISVEPKSKPPILNITSPKKPDNALTVLFFTSSLSSSNSVSSNLPSSFTSNDMM